MTMMAMIGDIMWAWSPSNLMDLVLKEEPTFSDLATIIAFIATAIAIIFEIRENVETRYETKYSRGSLFDCFG